ncbi:crossover junction endodeoxyribonuclease RuvC [Thermosipho sp. (in: thermotogales)]|jgi:Holliday junction resolvasome RuvABC endonuclease subunit|uniref:crossover junction endodeoxyribonuclease RuvC n=1 Tax=Thermosipho sp. (in: thermotogales) TaxID=1968895 RepID=UPI0025808379|nr:crossover junction endodeoxyribonuclease RuvC [Thermosipho sp. (in: thermotogales)]MBZ4649260.1 putative phage protein [Thermosipho sp. (in: thermotogales)]
MKFKKLITIGIDPSITGTAVTKFNGDEFEDYWFFSEVKSICRNNKHGIYQPKFENQIEKLIWGIEKVIEIIDKSKPDYIAIEDYAFRAQGRVFHIGGYVEGIKMEIYRRRIPLRLYDPLRVKQFVTGKGNSDKPAMALSAYKKWGIDFSDAGQYSNNIVDAYSINKLLILELKLKQDSKLKDKLTEVEKHIFLTKNKHDKECLIDREFIIRGGNSDCDSS